MKQKGFVLRIHVLLVEKLEQVVLIGKKKKKAQM